MKQKNSLQDQVLEHIHRKLQERFGVAGADRIMPKLSTRLCEMAASPDATVSVGNESGDVGRMAESVENETDGVLDTVEAGTTGEPAEDAVFLNQLNSIVYPFIALMQVLEELPTDAASETLRIWNTLPWTVVDRARRSI